MKKLILLLIVISACNIKSKENSIDNLEEKNTQNMNIPKQIVANFQIDTLGINSQNFIPVFKDSLINCLISVNGDTIIKSENFYSQVKILDINEDGFQDIRVFIFSKTPNQCDNYLFDNKLNTFYKVENCDSYIQKIKGTNYYYSYNSSGCSDLNWESYLSKIVNKKLVNFGYIYGKGCNNDIQNNPQEIAIYKITNSKKLLIHKLPYSTQISSFDEKCNFIEKYWNNNSQKFNP